MLNNTWQWAAACAHAQRATCVLCHVDPDSTAHKWVLVCAPPAAPPTLAPRTSHPPNAPVPHDCIATQPTSQCLPPTPTQRASSPSLTPNTPNTHMNNPAPSSRPLSTPSAFCPVRPLLSTQHPSPPQRTQPRRPPGGQRGQALEGGAQHGTAQHGVARPEHNCPGFRGT